MGGRETERPDGVGIGDVIDAATGRSGATAAIAEED